MTERARPVVHMQDDVRASPRVALDLHLAEERTAVRRHMRTYHTLCGALSFLRDKDREGCTRLLTRLIFVVDSLPSPFSMLAHQAATEGACQRICHSSRQHGQRTFKSSNAHNRSSETLITAPKLSNSARGRGNVSMHLSRSHGMSTHLHNSLAR